MSILDELTKGEQREILDYIHARLECKAIDTDKLPGWLAELENTRQLCERQRIVIEHLFNAIEAAGLMLDEAYKQAQSQSTQTGSNEK